MVSSPLCVCVYSAASTAPKAKPLREWASWVMVMLSASESYTTLCMPGTSSRRMLSMASWSALQALVPINNLFGQCDGGAAGGIELMYVVRFFHVHIILCKAVHNFG